MGTAYNQIKMVIWDLDDTFWQGTLAESNITLRQSTIDLVIVLSKRSIVSSICSKNDYDEAQRVLEERGVWSYFVFPRIEFTAKGASIAALIEQANLRQHNVLFIDDNRLNLEEARYHAPDLMTAHPNDILPNLLDLPQAAGKDDPNLTKLLQYKHLEYKIKDLKKTPLKHEDFLRQCNIRVEIDVDVDDHLDRVIELINRSNQLNFTKVRIETQQERDTFKKSLRDYGFHAGIVKATDRYGDYGVIGFFLTIRTAIEYRLCHFVFSCRIMNMGIEQYVYEMLNEPECPIVLPVAYDLKPFAKVDWIKPYDVHTKAITEKSDKKLLLLGGCDLLQVATYCSTNRVEYVNAINSGESIRYDDLGFILSSRDNITASSKLPMVPCWTKEDALHFDVDLSNTHTLIASLWQALTGDYILLDGDIIVRLAPNLYGLGHGFNRSRAIDLNMDQYTFIRLTNEQKQELTLQSFDRMVHLSPNAHARFLLGANTREVDREYDARCAYNALASEYCAKHGTFEFISVDDIVPREEILDLDHFTRHGYFYMASKIVERVKAREIHPPLQSYSCPPAPSSLWDIIQNAELLTLSDSGFIETDVAVGEEFEIRSYGTR